MPRKRPVTVSVSPDKCFVKELAGETPPSLESMLTLYEVSSQLFGLRPWRILEEDNLIVVRDSVSGELCFCSVMGAAGEVYSMHAYIGTPGLRLFHKVRDRALTGAGEFFAIAHCFYVEFVPKAELLKQDRELLAALRHPQGRGMVSPIFRTLRPGFLPWFVNADEARTLTECIRAVISVRDAVVTQQRVTFWDRSDTYPMVTRIDGAEPRYEIEMFHAPAPPEPPIAPAHVAEETLSAIRGQDYALRGVLELDLTYSATAVGEKGQRAACAALALAVDAESGMVLAPDVAVSSLPAGDALAKVFLKAIQVEKALPREVRVRNQRFQETLAPLMEFFGTKVRVAKKLPAMDEAMAGLLQFMG